MKRNTAFQTLAVLANINEMAAAILPQLVGNELSNKINGEPVRHKTIYNLAMAEVQKSFPVKEAN